MLFFWSLSETEFSLETFLITTDKTLTEPERIFNYTFGIFLIFCFLISNFLNPIMIYHHISNNKQGTTNFLFSCLTISDLLTTLFSPIVYAVYMIKPRVSGLVEPVIGVVGLISCTFGCVSQCSTALLAATRFIKIASPFERIKRRILVVYLTGYSVFMFVNNFILCLSIFVEDVAHLFPVVMKCCFFTNVSHCSLGILFSVLTIIYVYFVKTPSQTDHVTKSVCGTILLMNIVYVVTMSSAFFPLLVYMNIIPPVKSLTFNLTIFTFYVMPALTAAWNPLVLLFKAQAIRETFTRVLGSALLWMNKDQIGSKSCEFEAD